ncbi:MAG: efflux RND transporter periplasmic adaptor subunit [Betaproteobacteria bacterium]|nr:efflux RND transporter periplasmic adaptor subunit [Betaproteobacteria bacterium]
MKHLPLHALLAAALLIGSLAARADEPAAPSVLVQTQALTQHTLRTTLTGYGVLVPATSSTTTLSAARPGRVAALAVGLGQRVRRGATLATLNADPGAVAAVQQAQAALDLTKGELERTQRLLADQLATQSQLSTAQKNLRDAQSALDAQLALGSAKGQDTLRAPFDGVVVAVTAALGDRVAAGAPIVQVARSDALLATVGIEPEDSSKVRAGMPATLHPVLGEGPVVAARVTDVRGLVNPQTQLVDVQLKPKAGMVGGLIPGVRVRADIELGSVTGYAVPRNAVLQDGQGSYLYQTDGRTAKRVSVTAGPQQGGLLIVRGPLNPALRVVVTGNYELRDGMALREQAQ